MDDDVEGGESKDNNDDSFDVIRAPDVSREMLVRYFNWYRATKL